MRHRHNCQWLSGLGHHCCDLLLSFRIIGTPGWPEADSLSKMWESVAGVGAVLSSRTLIAPHKVAVILSAFWLALAFANLGSSIGSLVECDVRGEVCVGRTSESVDAPHVPTSISGSGLLLTGDGQAIIESPNGFRHYLLTHRPKDMRQHNVRVDVATDWPPWHRIQQR